MFNSKVLDVIFVNGNFCKTKKKKKNEKHNFIRMKTSKYFNERFFENCQFFIKKNSRVKNAEKNKSKIRQKKTANLF